MIHPASHCPLLVLSRGNGRSAVAAAAYILRTAMTDHRTGLSFNYRRTQGLICGGLVNWKGEVEDLWNAAEAAEKRINARVARELRPALPAELPLDDQRRLVHGFACWLKDQYRVAVQYALHAPTFHEKAVGKALWRKRRTNSGWNAYIAALKDPQQTNLNFHAHILFTVREVDPKSGDFGKKTRVLDNVTTGPAELKAIRAEWEKRTNAALRNCGSTARIDLRSYEAMAEAGDAPEGLVAQAHLGPRETARARKRGARKEPHPKTRAETWRDDVRSANEERWACWLRVNALRREKARLDESRVIAARREAERRERVESEKRRLAEARSAAEQAEAIETATTIDMVRPPCDFALQQAIAWAQGNGSGSVHATDGSAGTASADDNTMATEPAHDEFDQVIDPETYASPGGEDTRERTKPIVRKADPRMRKQVRTR